MVLAYNVRTMVLTKRDLKKLVLTDNAKNYDFELLLLAPTEKSFINTVNVGS